MKNCLKNDEITVKRNSNWLYQETSTHFSVKPPLYYFNKRKVQKKVTENELTVNDLKIAYMHVHTHILLAFKEEYTKKRGYNNNKVFITYEVLNLAEKKRGLDV